MYPLIGAFAFIASKKVRVVDIRTHFFVFI